MYRVDRPRAFRGQLSKFFARFDRSKNVDFKSMEDTLIESDFGPALSQRLTNEIRSQQPHDWQQLQEVLESILVDTLTTTDVTPQHNCLTIVLILGVNGVGKTTALAKLAHRFQGSHAVMLAAGDTFRAAAIEQLVQHGNNMGISVVRQKRGADAAAVVYDAIASAKARGIELLLVDTAGRMHNRDDLIAELSKIAKVAQKNSQGLVHHLLAIDATTGQNAIEQARVFHRELRVDSLLLTKFDSSARGGTAFALSQQLGLPFSLLGTGEKMTDIEPFDARRFTRKVIGLN